VTLRLLALLLLLVTAASPSLAAAQDVQIDFDEWPDLPCTTPGLADCEEAYVYLDRPPEPANEMQVTSCGSGQCLDVRWTAEGAIRSIKTAWAPEPGLHQAYAQIKILFENDYRSGMAPNGFNGPEYQPLIRFLDETEEFGIDLAVVNGGDSPPYVIIASAPDTSARGPRYNSSIAETCHLDLPNTRGFWTIELELELHPEAPGTDRCVLRVDGMRSEMTGIDFRGPSGLDDSQVELRKVIFLERVSNGTDPCGNDSAWPPCGGEESRTVTVDDLCVSDRLNAADDETCLPGSLMGVDAETPTGDGGLDHRASFRGVGGCECTVGVARGRAAAPWLAGAFALLALGRLRWRR